MVKLYLVKVECDGMNNSFLLVGESKECIEEKVQDMYRYDYIEYLDIKEVDDVNGYKIKLEKINN